ncbi:hypothetical protein [Kitasatospora sp. MMS16-BH015]|uniref:hypothetical protein n=1 Tax=Kitasatospora sp. MMS16-BH015 TaxID=2018025 RepID=UPI000CF2D2E6|nr:hypothetical protein [Kitasatospora sp. MMS16-BH015]
MRINRRTGLLAAGAVLATGLLPVQSAVAAQLPAQLNPVCDTANGGSRPWTADQPFTLKGGNDFNTYCRVRINGYGGDLRGLTASYTISAASVTASGYTARQLARMIVPEVGVGDATHSISNGVWTPVVGEDGSLSLRSAAFDLLPAWGQTIGTVDFLFSASSGPRSARLHGTFALTSAQGDSVQADADLDYVADGHPAPTGQAGTFKPLTPVRALDTRSAIGAPKGPVGPGREVALQVAGANGVPASGVTAVVLNVTATDTTHDGYVTVYPHGTARPTASSLNFKAGQTVPNLVTVPVGADGKVSLYNFLGTTSLVADISGYYTSDGTGSRYTTAGPTRVMDTRYGTGVAKAPAGPNGQVDLQVTGRSGVPASGVTAVVLNVTATNASRGGYLTVYPHGEQRPTASNLNFTAGQTVPNLVTVPVGADGKISFYNFLGTTDLVADLAGYYSGSGSVFVPTGPTRVLDSRNGTGGVNSPVWSGNPAVLQVSSWKNGIPAFGVQAVALNVTATNPTAASYVTVYPNTGADRPTASNLNFTAHQTVANAAITPNARNGVAFYNFAGTTDLVADLAGYFTAD